MTLRGLILSLALAIAASAAVPITVHDPAFLGPKGAAAVTVLQPTFLTNYTSNVGTAFHQTEEFTPSSNALIVVNILGDTLADSLTVTNTGTTNLTWWFPVRMFRSSVYLHRWAVSQLPIGTAPFAMRVTATIVNNPDGMNIHVWEVTNANTTALWGTNAIVQSIWFTNTTTSPASLTFTNGAADKDLVMASIYSNTDVGAGTAFLVPDFNLGFHSAAGSGVNYIDTWIRTNTPAGFTTLWATNSPDDDNFGISMLEIKP